MAQVLVRDLDPEIVGNLKDRASRNGRSLEAELRMILSDASRYYERKDKAVRNIKHFRSLLKGRSFPDSTDLIREDRDR